VGIFFLLLSVQSAFALRFSFVYDPAPKYAQYWTKDLKDQVTEAGNFLASYIADAHTVEIYVTIDESTTAFATGSPNYSVTDYAVTNTATKFIARKGKVNFSVNSAKTASESSNVALVIHELMHCLGVTNNINGFKQFIVGNTFTGPKTKAMNSNGVAPLASDLSHFAFSKANAPLGVGPRINEGGGNLFSCIDLAVLSDIGYDVPLVKTANAPFHVNLTLNSLYAGRMKPEFGGFLTLDGLAGNDVLIAGDKKMRMTGGAGNDTYYITAGTGHDVIGFEANDKIIIASSLGITQAQINNPELKFRETGMKFTGTNTAEYKLSIGTFSMSVWNSTMPSKTNITVGNLDGSASTPVAASPAQPAPSTNQPVTTSSNSFSNAVVRFKNRYTANQWINIEGGPVAAGNVPAAFISAQWRVVPVAGTKFVRLQNVWKPTLFLNIEKGPIEASAVPDAFLSGHWELEEVIENKAAGAPTHYRLKSRWKPEIYLNTEKGKLEASAVPTSFQSANWIIERI